MKRFLCLLLLATPVALADTLELTTGVRVDGILRELPNGLLELDAGGRKVLYRPEEVASIERNEKTGALNLEEIKAQVAAEEAEWLERTGLNGAQRREILQLLYRLQRSETTERIAVRDALVAMQQRMDVYRFLTVMLPELSHRLTPALLEVLCYIDADRGVVEVREHLNDSFAGTRAKAIELLASLKDSRSIPQIARGLKDHDDNVVSAALNALAALGARESTPALIELLSNPNIRLANASRNALQSLWQGETGLKVPQSAEEWNALWQTKQGSVSGALQLASIQPLIQPEEEFQNE